MLFFIILLQKGIKLKRVLHVYSFQSINTPKQSSGEQGLKLRTVWDAGMDAIANKCTSLTGRLQSAVILSARIKMPDTIDLLLK